MTSSTTTDSSSTLATGIDAFDLEILEGRLDSVTRDMAIALVRTSGSPGLTDAKDFGCSLYDKDGNQLSFGAMNYIHSGSAMEALAALFRDYDTDEIEPGDIFITNDPYWSGAIHPGDVTAFRPIFRNDRLVAWAANETHMLDFGGMSPGTFAPHALECYQEALRLPVVKLMRRGTIDKGMWNLIENNVRVSHKVGMDLRSLLSALIVAERRTLETIDLYGIERFEQLSTRLMDSAEDAARRRIAQLPNGVYEGWDWSEHDGHEDRLFDIRAKLVVDDDQVTFDLSESSEQAKGFINSTRGAVLSAMFTALMRQLFHDIPFNAGTMRPVELVSKKGTIVEAEMPAPIGIGYVESSFKVTDVCLMALNRAIACSEGDLRERVMGGWGNCWPLMAHAGMDQYGNYTVFTNMDGSGNGGAGLNGLDGCPVGAVGVQVDPAIPDVEIHERNYPMLFLFRRLQRNSGGPGKWRGGLGMEEAWTPHRTAGMDSVLVSQRVSIPTPGGFGGYPAGASQMRIIDDVPSDLAALVRHGSASKFAERGELLWPKDERHIGAGEILYIAFGGGGGFADPVDREPSRVLADLHTGAIDEDQAKGSYGVVVVDGEVDHVATEKLRTDHRTRRLQLSSTTAGDNTELLNTGRLLGQYTCGVDVLEVNDGLRLRCQRCSCDLGNGHRSWKEQVGVIDLDVDDDHVRDLGVFLISRRHEPTTRWRMWICPRCALALEVNVVPSGHPTPFDARPQIFT